MASSSSPSTRKKPVHPHPAHKCAYGPCCNYAVPPAKGRKHRCCSEECLAGLLVELRQYIPSRTCKTWFSGTGTRVHCPSCLIKREAKRELARQSERWPKKKCLWTYCQKEFQPGAATEGYCSAECRKIGLRGHSGPGYPRKMPPADHVFCAGNCGEAFREGHSSPWGTEWTRCTPCWLGQQNSLLHPFGPPLRPGWHRCQWVFCNALYRAERPDQRACCVLHEKLRAARTPGRFNHYGRTHAYSHHTCANHCGTTLLYASQPVCLPCLLGLRYGRVNPFSEDAGERARWGEQAWGDQGWEGPIVHLTGPKDRGAEGGQQPVAPARPARSPGPAVLTGLASLLASLLAAGLGLWWAAGKCR